MLRDLLMVTFNKVHGALYFSSCQNECRREFQSVVGFVNRLAVTSGELFKELEQ